MASPLTMYVPIKQDATTQALAAGAIDTFTASVSGALTETGIVHYATLALVPNTNGEGAIGILLMTDFDLAMNPYLKTFWIRPGIADAIKGIATIALNDPGSIDTFEQFVTFINSVNLTPAPEDLKWKNFYEAYNLTVEQILALQAAAK